MKKLILMVLSLSTMACATGYDPRYSYNEVLAVNLTSGTITDVIYTVIDADKADKTRSCSEVLKNAMCSERFAKRPYPNEGIQLSWTHTDGSSKTEILTPAISVTYYTAFPLRIVMEINADGSVTSSVEQETPFVLLDSNRDNYNT